MIHGIKPFHECSPAETSTLYRWGASEKKQCEGHVNSRRILAEPGLLSR